MRSSFAVLLLSQDERLAEATHRVVCGQSSFELLVAGGFDEAMALWDEVEPCALVAHLDAGLGDEAVAQILWRASLLQVLVPVVVVSDHYDQSRATTLFQLGVTDYLGRSEHLAKLGDLLASAVANAIRTRERDPASASRAALLDESALAEAPRAGATPHLLGLRRFSVLGEG